MQQFSYTVSAGQATATGNVTVMVAAAESLVVTVAYLCVATGTVTIGTNLNASVLGTAGVDVTGTWHYA